MFPQLKGMVYLQYTLLLLILKEDVITKITFFVFTIHFATINTL